MGKYRDRPRNIAFMVWIESLACLLESPQCYGGTEAAHCGERAYSHKSADEETLPLCAAHHRNHENSLHKMGRFFWAFWGLDRVALIIEHQELFSAIQQVRKSQGDPDGSTTSVD